MLFGVNVLGLPIEGFRGIWAPFSGVLSGAVSGRALRDCVIGDMARGWTWGGVTTALDMGRGATGKGLTFLRGDAGAAGGE